MPYPTPRRIVVIAGDDGIDYLIARYANRAGIDVRVAATLTPELLAAPPVAVWYSSMEALEHGRPRESGVVGDDAAVVVCSSVSDERRARELGADYCTVHPLTYPDFVAAMTAVRGDGSRPPSGG